MNANEVVRYPLTDKMVDRIKDASVRHISPDPMDFYTVRREGYKTVYTVYAHVGGRTLPPKEVFGIGTKDDEESSVVCAMIRAYGKVPLEYASAAVQNTVEAVMYNPKPADTIVAASKPVTAKPAVGLETAVRGVRVTGKLPIVTAPRNFLSSQDGFVVGYGWGV